MSTESPPMNSALPPCAGSPSVRIAELEAELKSLRRVNRVKRRPKHGLGGVIQRMREERGMTISDLADKAILSKGLLSGMEQGNCANPSWQTIKALALALNVTAAHLAAEITTAENQRYENQAGN